MRHRVTSRKTAGSIPSKVIVIFHLHHHSNRTVVLVSIQLLKEISTRDKCGRCVGLTTLVPSVAVCLDTVGASDSCSPKKLLFTL